VRDVSINGFQGIAKSPWFVLNVKVLIGIRRERSERVNKCKGFLKEVIKIKS